MLDKRLLNISYLTMLPLEIGCSKLDQPSNPNGSPWWLVM